jgi:5-methylthioribose kinase
MRLLDQQNAADYLRETKRVGSTEPLSIRELGGGVSNMVLLVERPQNPGHDFVIKQAREQLRTQRPWFASVERAWREAETLAICTRLIERTPTPQGMPAVCTPQIVFEDQEQYLFAMTAAPRPHATWKEQLLAGKVDPAIARACGWLLGTLHARSWRDAAIAQAIGDRTLFDQLRVDPYYRTLASVHPAIAPAVTRLIASLDAHPLALVHADFSPKNLLVYDGGLMMVDFETGHFGDPAFDLGFFLSHLVLKAFYHAPLHAPYLELTRQFCQAYDDALGGTLDPRELSALWIRGIRNFAACAWARLDGKSPVEYLSDRKNEPLRALCRRVLGEEPQDWDEVVACCRHTLD